MSDLSPVTVVAGNPKPGSRTLDAARRVAEGCTLARLAPSLGGPDTLVTHPTSTTAAGLSPDERVLMGIADGLVRVSVGLEHPDDVVADLAAAVALA